MAFKILRQSMVKAEIVLSHIQNYLLIYYQILIFIIRK